MEYKPTQSQKKRERILITRDIENSEILANDLKIKGYETSIYPLFKINHKKPNIFTRIWIKFQKISTILITSSNAIQYLERLKLHQNIKIIAIGQKTSQKLINSGYKNIITAEKSAKSLLKLAKKEINKNSFTIYLSGEIVTQAIDQDLIQQGFRAKRIISYTTEENSTLTDQIITEITNGDINQICIYSKNTANILHKLFLKHNLLEYCSTINLLCFSNEIINHCQELGFKNSSNINEILN